MNIINKSIGEIPFIEYDFNNKEKLIFLHANAFHPNCYLPLFKELGKKYNIVSPFFRPLWKNPGSPEILTDWSLLKNDMINFIENYGINKCNLLGHSLGGHIAFRIALERPNIINKAVLMDPIIFSQIKMFIWKFIQWTDFGYKHHPMIQISKNQKIVHSSKDELFKKYRKKNIFKKISDPNLLCFIDGLTKPIKGCQIKIAFPKDWELRIYQSGGCSDKYIWKNIKDLKNKILIFHAEYTHAPKPSIVKKIINKSEYINSKYLNGASHFFPFEIPIDLSNNIVKYLN